MIEINNKELIDDFSDYLKIDKNYSKNTLESYIRDLRFFLEYTNKEVIDITKKDIDNYILHVLPLYNESSINRIIASIKSFYKYLSLFKGYVNISEDVECLKRKKSLPKYLSIEEVDKLLDIKIENSFDYRNKTILELLYSTGLRATELVNLDIINIDIITRGIILSFDKIFTKSPVLIACTVLSNMFNFTFSVSASVANVSTIAAESLGFTNSNVNVVISPITTDTKVVIINTPNIVVITLPKRLGCLIFAIDVVIVKNINGTMITNIKFINKSPNGLNTAAFSPYTNPTIAPIIKAPRRIIVCL